MTEPEGLRRLRVEDAPHVLDAFVAGGAEMLRQGDVRTLATATAYCERLLGQLAFVADLPDLPVAALVAISVDEANRNGWMFYWSHPQARGQGVTKAAARAVANWALSPDGADLHRLELGHRANNPASRGVALAAGFVHEGTEREKFLVDGERIDVLTYGRLRTDH